MSKILALFSCSILAAAACGGDDEGPPAREASLEIEGGTVVAEVDERFLSVAVDSAQVVGGVFWDPSGMVEGGVGTHRVDPYDFSNPKIRALAAELAPAYLRIGGSEADRVYYDLSDDPITEVPEGYHEVMTREQWDGVGQFAKDLGYEIMFTFNAGPGPRDEELTWDPTGARTVVEHAVANDFPVALWELGNEPNGFRLILGIDVDGVQLAEDYATFAAMIDELDPDGGVGGPSSAFWPEVGEIAPVLPEFMDAGGGDHLDVVTWHYDPPQSRRCPVANRRATPTPMMQPVTLDEVHAHAMHVESERDEHAPAAEVWLGESGHAQCGGEPGVTNTMAGSFWWLDQLGILAERGHRVVVRQTLSGSDYGLLDDETLDPAPDYWASLLWRRLMGTRVLDVEVTDELTDEEGRPFLRSYAHCTRAGAAGSVTVLALNLDLEQSARVQGFDTAGELYLVTAAGEDFLSLTVELNGTELLASAEGEVPAIEPVPLAAGETLVLPPTSYAFVVLPEADAPACR